MLKIEDKSPYGDNVYMCGICKSRDKHIIFLTTGNKERCHTEVICDDCFLKLKEMINNYNGLK